MHSIRTRTLSRFLPMLLLSGGCQTAILDMRAVEEPVMLNALPYAVSDFEVEELDPFYATVGDAAGFAVIGPIQTKSSTMRENSVQANAFELIGGHRDRAIARVEVNASGGGANLLIGFLGSADVSVRGAAFVIRSPAAEPPSGPGAPAEREAP